MDNEKNIPIEDYCRHYSIEASFVRSLNDNGLIELTKVNESYCIDYGQLNALEKYMHMHYDLDINMEGIEAISHLLQRIDNLQAELRMLRNRISE